MSTFAETLQNAISSLAPGDTHEISLKLKPLTAVGNNEANTSPSSNPQLPSAQTSSSGSAASQSVGISSDQNPLLGSPAAAKGLVAGLTNKPLQLDTTAPLGSQTDAMYEAAAAQLAQAAQAKYLDYLQQLGYVDQNTGQLIPGTLETEAIRQRYDLNRQILEAQRNVDEAAMQGGTVFSGRRAQLQGLRTEPLYQSLANVDTDLARAVSENLMGINQLQSQFTVDRNLLVAEAAQRIADRARAAGAAGAGGPPGPDGGGSPDDNNPPSPPATPLGPNPPLWLMMGADPFGRPLNPMPDFGMSGIDDYLASLGLNRFQTD